MGFYQPFTIIKDAQRHGLKVLPVDVTRSNWECTMESVSRQSSVVSGQMNDAETRRSGEMAKGILTTDHPPPTTDPGLRLGLLCVKGLREEAGRAMVRARSERSFSSLDDLHRRVPELRKDELRKLAAVGALNFIGSAGILPADVRGTFTEGKVRASRSMRTGCPRSRQHTTARSPEKGRELSRNVEESKKTNPLTRAVPAEAAV